MKKKAAPLKKMEAKRDGIKIRPRKEREKFDKEREMILTGRFRSEAATEIKEHTAKNLPQEQKIFSFIPDDVARPSPFFIMNRREMANRPLDRRSHSYGKTELITSGPKLAVYDETILLILLSIVAEKQIREFSITSYKICKMAGVKRSTREYKSIWKSIENLGQTSLIFYLKGDDGKVFKRKIRHILTADEDVKTRELGIKFSNFFLDMFYDDSITYIDLKLRASLKGDITKALYRFYRSQTGPKYSCNIITLCNHIRLNTDSTMKYLRHRIRTALRELKSKKFLSSWQLSKNGIVSIEKTKRSILRTGIPTNLCGSKANAQKSTEEPKA